MILEELLKFAPLVSAIVTLITMVLFVVRTNDIMLRLQSVLDTTVIKVQALEIELTKVKTLCDARHEDCHVKIRPE